MILLETLWNTNYGDWSCKCFGHCRLGFPDEWILRLSDFREPSGPSSDWPTRSNFAAPRKTIEVGILESKDREDQQGCFPNWYSKWTPSNSVRQRIQIWHYRVSHCSPKTTHDLQVICRGVPRQPFEFRQVVTYWKRKHVPSERPSKYTHIYYLLRKLDIVNHQYDSVLSMMYYECGGDLGGHIFCFSLATKLGMGGHCLIWSGTYHRTPYPEPIFPVPRRLCAGWHTMLCQDSSDSSIHFHWSSWFPSTNASFCIDVHLDLFL